MHAALTCILNWTRARSTVHGPTTVETNASNSGTCERRKRKLHNAFMLSTDILWLFFSYNMVKYAVISVFRTIHERREEFSVCLCDEQRQRCIQLYVYCICLWMDCCCSSNWMGFFCYIRLSSICRWINVNVRRPCKQRKYSCVSVWDTRIRHEKESHISLLFVGWLLSWRWFGEDCG